MTLQKRLIYVCTPIKFAESFLQALKTLHICKKVKKMITLLTAYAVFWDLLDRERIYQEKDLDFPTICEYIGIDRERLDNLLYEETGVYGQDILARFRGIDFSRKND